MPTAAASRKTCKLSVALNSTDKLLIAFWCLLAILSLVLHSRIPMWPIVILADLCASILVCALACAAHSTDSKALRWAHDWAAFPLLVFTYKQLYFIVGPIHQNKIYDPLFIAIDLWLFRAHPTEWLAQFSNPFLTEVLQIAYSLFYILFLAAGLELYRSQDLSQFRYFRFTVLYGFFISYIGYFFLPAVGPRFTLHDFSRIDVELPGLLFTTPLRWFVNICESIPSGVSNAVALAGAQRDVFPSAHVMMTLVTAVLAYRYRLRIRTCVFVPGMLLIFASVYLRYHYAVDVIAGALLVLPCMLTSNPVRDFLKSGFHSRDR